MATKTRGRRKSRGVNKAQAIRDEFAAQGAQARPKDVIAALKAKGITVSSAQVSNIKATLGHKKRTGKRVGAHAGNGLLSLELLVETKKLADRLGGIEVARKALDALSRLV